MSEDLRAAAIAVLDACRARGLKVATAESCTGGLVAGALTDIAGSSDVVDRGFVTYSNEAKQQMLGVPADILQRARRGQPANRRSHGARRARQSAAPISWSPSPASPAPAAAAPTSRSASCISPLPRAAAQLTHAEMRYGDIGRS